MAILTMMQDKPNRDYFKRNKYYYLSFSFFYTNQDNNIIFRNISPVIICIHIFFVYHLFPDDSSYTEDDLQVAGKLTFIQNGIYRITEMIGTSQFESLGASLQTVTLPIDGQLR